MRENSFILFITGVEHQIHFTSPKRLLPTSNDTNNEGLFVVAHSCMDSFLNLNLEQIVTWSTDGMKCKDNALRVVVLETSEICSIQAAFEKVFDISLSFGDAASFLRGFRELAIKEESHNLFILPEKFPIHPPKNVSPTPNRISTYEKLLSKMNFVPVKQSS